MTVNKYTINYILKASFSKKYINYSKNNYLMPYSYIMPIINKTNMATSDIIISILSQDYPMTTKKIYNIARKQYSSNITYQAFYKVILSMVEKKALIKKGFEYEINISWIMR